METMNQVIQEDVTATMITTDSQVTCVLAVCAILSPNTEWKHSVPLHLIKYKVQGISHTSTGLSLPSTLPLCG